MPSPRELIREYDDLVNLFADVEDAKTGEKFFKRKAWALFGPKRLGRNPFVIRLRELIKQHQG